MISRLVLRRECECDLLDNLVIFARSHHQFPPSNVSFHYVILRFRFCNFVNQTQKMNGMDWMNGFLLRVCYFVYLDLVISRSTTAWTHSSHWIASRISYFTFFFVSSSLSLHRCYVCCLKLLLVWDYFTTRLSILLLLAVKEGWFDSTCLEG